MTLTKSSFLLLWSFFVQIFIQSTLGLSEIPSYQVPTCNVPAPCTSGYSCFPCIKSDDAVCVLPVAAFPGMTCCNSYLDHFTACDTARNPSCCDSSPFTPSQIAAIIIGSILGFVALGILAWFITTKIRKNDDHYQEISPTIQAESMMPPKRAKIHEDHDAPDIVDSPLLSNSAFKQYQSF